MGPMTASEHLNPEQFSMERLRALPANDYPGSTVGDLEKHVLTDENWSGATEGLDEHDVHALHKSIESRGILQPLGVMRHRGQESLVDGHNRALAAQRAGLPEVPVIVRPRSYWKRRLT